jgi:hypothetical protein
LLVVDSDVVFFSLRREKGLPVCDVYGVEERTTDGRESVIASYSKVEVLREWRKK